MLPRVTRLFSTQLGKCFWLVTNCRALQKVTAGWTQAETVARKEERLYVLGHSRLLEGNFLNTQK